ncbi:MAG: PadR family transcriptional regulator [Candidatus Hodarchaeota archaeon]
MNLKDPLTEELTKWVKREIDQLSNSALRLALLAIINQNQSIGIYGYAIGENLYSVTKGELGGTNATFYAILRRLEQDQLVMSELKPSPAGPARKYYRLTTKGERAYHALFENWQYYYTILENLIEGS